MEGRFISYLRVSTTKQGIDGLGIEAQKKAIADFLNGGRWKVLDEFVEVESGKRDDNRPQLQAAIAVCKRKRATLLIAKLDRLSRNVAFIANLMESGVEFIAADMPHANKLTVQIMAAMAEYEREMISKRTKDALAAAKARGVRLGNPYGLSQDAMGKGVEAAKAARIRKADAYAESVRDIITECREQGLSLNAIARKLADEGEPTPRGGYAWTPTTVRNALARMAA